jgi:hypothetical protein
MPASSPLSQFATLKNKSPVTCKNTSLLFVRVGVGLTTTRLGGLGMWANLDPTRWEKPAPFIYPPANCSS